MTHKCDKCGKIKKTKRHSKFTMFDIDELVVYADLGVLIIQNKTKNNNAMVEDHCYQ